MRKKMTKAEKAVYKLSQLNKLVFALREAGLKGGLWKPGPDDIVCEDGKPYRTGKRNEAQR